MDTALCVQWVALCAPGVTGGGFLDAKEFSLYLLGCSTLGLAQHLKARLLSLLFTTTLCELALFSCRN